MGRSKEQIVKDREKLKELIQNMSSVEELMEWKYHPYQSDNQIFTVEAYNDETIKALSWERPDVLYSFLGIYVIGLAAYYPDEIVRNGRIEYKTGKKKVYNEKVVHDLFQKKQKLYKEGKLAQKDMLDFNPQLIEFTKVYFSIGNVIPTWPGANVDRGRASMYDIPELYYSKYEVWTKMLNEVYRNAFLEDLLDPGLVFENQNEILYAPPFWNFQSTEDFLDNIVKEEYPEGVRRFLYTKWLERIVGIINKRSNQINDWLNK